MLEDHVLDSSMDAMKIMIYLEFWHQDHRFIDIIKRRNEDGVLAWNSNKPWMMKILRSMRRYKVDQYKE